ncbi:MAG: tRNA 2-thiouridine(34) synthase MnmA [Spirochaetales bacterium]|nr:tRNA 2-thiouridine(34) synthase MnmA [Spirochaetales bacterium]
MENKQNKVLLGLSGGVDSAVSAHILLERGYDVIGIMMNTYRPELYPDIQDKPHIGKGCFGNNDNKAAEDAKKVADHYGIDFRIVDVADEFKETIISYFRSEYKSGHTPNPCILCNRTMKFGLMLEKARQLGIQFDYFATGHYAKIEPLSEGGPNVLKRANFREKDQSYFLSFLPFETLQHVIFPLGDYTKPQVRQIASRIGLFNSGKTESMDFYTGDYNDIVYMGESPVKKGNIVDISGRVLGTHNGISHYTIGQRKGLRISSDEPLYVTKLIPERNEVVVDYIDGLEATHLTAREFNQIYPDISFPIECEVKIRYRHTPAKATVYKENNQKIRIEFAEPQRAVTPGQLACLYKDDIVLGSGWIEE